MEREKVREQIEDKLEQPGVPHDAVIIEVTGPTELLGDTLTSEPPVRPTVGGLQINDGIDSVCSLGFNVIREANGVARFITNSHCTATNAGEGDGRPIHQRDTPPENRLGIETIDPSHFDKMDDPRCPASRLCRWSDAAFVRYDDDVQRAQGRIARVPLGSLGAISPTHPSFRISAESAAPE